MSDDDKSPPKKRGPRGGDAPTIIRDLMRELPPAGPFPQDQRDDFLERLAIAFRFVYGKV